MYVDAYENPLVCQLIRKKSKDVWTDVLCMENNAAPRRHESLNESPSAQYSLSL